MTDSPEAVPGELSGRVVAVVGAGGGLGRPICAALAARGAELVLAGPHAERLPTDDHPDALCVELDLRDAGAGDRLVAAVMERHGRLDGLVNAAGIVAFGPLVETDDTVIEELFLVNVIGPLWLLRRVTPLLEASSGFVALLSAVVAEQPMAGMVPYAATKGALSAADKGLFRELRRSGIRVCDVRPPHTETGLADRPLAGTAPKLPEGLDPSAVASRIVDAIVAGDAEVPADAFG